MAEWGKIDKPLRDLIEIIHFTESVSTKIHGALDEAEIYRTVKKEFTKSKRYTASILLLTDDESALRVAETSARPGKLKATEKATGLRLRGYRIDLNKSSIYSQVVREGKTVQVNASDILGELLPRPLARLISEAMGYVERPAILTPLKRHGEIIGALAMTSTELAEYFIPSVRNLAQHISTALELADEYAERKRAEEALRESEEELRAIFDGVGDGIALIDVTGKVVRVNKRIVDVGGYAEEEIVGKRFELFKMFPPQSLAKMLSNFTKLISGQQIPPFEVEVYTKAGEKRNVELRGSLLRQRGKTVGMVGVMRDISERKRAEEEIRQRNRELTALNAIATVVSQSLNLDEILNAGLDKVLELVHSNVGGIYLADPEQGKLDLVVHRGISKEFAREIESVSVDEKTLEAVIAEGKLRRFILSVEAVMKDRVELKRILSAMKKEGLSLASGAPVLLQAKEEILGLMIVARRVAQPYSEAELQLLASIGQQIALAIQNAQLYKAAQQELAERKRAEEALRRAEREKETILDSLVEHVVHEDMEMKILWANRAACESASLAREELIGRHCYEIWPKRSEPCLDCSVVKAIETGQPQEVEKTTPDGRAWFIRGYPVRDEKGDIVGGVEVTLEITKPKRAERLLQALNQAALAMGRALTHEEIFTAVAEELKKLGFSCMVFPTDESQSRLFTKYLSYETAALKAAERLVDLQHEDFSIPIETIDVYRQVVWEKKTIFVENVEDIMEQVLPKLASGFAGQIVKMLKVWKYIPAPLIVEDKVIGVFSVQSDDLIEDDVPAITAFAHQMAAAWRKAELMRDLEGSLEELKQTQAQLLQAQKMEAIGQLAGGIAHDFNNLLTPIGGFAELLLQKAPEVSQEQEYLRQIKIAAGRAAALTRQLLLFTRQAVRERRPVQLNSVVEETCDLLERSIPKEITIELRLEPELWAVGADPSQISQVLMNLCVNARDAMPDGGILTLETRNVTLDEEYARMVLAAQPGRYVCLSVSDTGIGMSPEMQARLFEPFFTTKEVSKGTGLGLSVVYGIVKGHGGFIDVYSEERRGSTFHVYLPAIELAVEEREVEGLELPIGTETILLVDDEETVQALGQRVLERCGYTVLMAENGVQALEMYQAHRGKIGLVVLDVVMPEMGGLECLRRLRELDPQVKVLISTGYTAKGLAQELVAEGALGMVEKPFQLQDFVTAVRAAMDKS